MNGVSALEEVTQRHGEKLSADKKRAVTGNLIRTLILSSQTPEP